jgi:hypothetical protein
MASNIKAGNGTMKDALRQAEIPKEHRKAPHTMEIRPNIARVGWSPESSTVLENQYTQLPSPITNNPGQGLHSLEARITARFR